MKTLFLTLMEYPFTIPPLGSAAVAAAAGRAGHEAEHRFFFADAEKRDYNIITPGREQGFAPTNIAKIVADIEELRPDLVGFSCFIANRRSTELVARELRKRRPELSLVAGGPDIHPVDSGESGISLHARHMDYLIQGEAEEKILRLLRAIEKKGSHPGDGAIFNCKAPVPGDTLSGYAEFPKDLSGLAFADFGAAPDFDRFRDPSGWFAGIPLSFSRGCTGNCSFCNRSDYARGIRFRSAESLMAEMERQRERYGLSRFIIVDDDPLCAPCLPEMEKLCGLLRGSDLAPTIYNARLSPRLAGPGTARRLAAAGFSRIQFGVESFSPAVRKHMGKPVRPELVDRVLRSFSRAGIDTGIYLIYGYPTETEEDFAQTYEWLKRNMGLLGTLNVNCFIMNDTYMKKRPGSYSYAPLRAGAGLCFWQSPAVSPETLWRRFFLLFSLLARKFPRPFSIADPEGNYLAGP